jgi:hypothetical protein
MPEDEWTLVAEAASIIFDGERRIQRAWRDPSIPFRGVPHVIPRTREPVEIPFAERARLVLDCRRQRAGRPRLWDYEFVEMRTADMERLAQEARPPTPQPPRAARAADAIRRDVTTVIAPNRRSYYSIDRGRVVLAAPDFPTAHAAFADRPVSEAPPPQPAQSVPCALVPEGVSELTRKIMTALGRRFPKGRPHRRRFDIFKTLQKDYGEEIGVFSMRAMDRAIHELWPPRGKRGRAAR